MMDCGVYSLTFPNGKFYIGSSCRFRCRTRIHECELESGRHPNDRLQKTFDKYKAMAKSLLLACRKEDLRFYEQSLIDALRPQLNLSRDAYRPEMTPEVCAKIAKAATGRAVSQETRMKMAKARKGRRHTPEAKALISRLAQGRKNSPETKAKMSTSHTGKKLSADHLANMSIAQTKRWENWRAATNRVISGRGLRHRRQKERAIGASV